MLMKIQTGWHVAVDSSELKRHKPLAVRRFGVDWVFWRDTSGGPVVMEDRCPHRSARLSLGIVNSAGSGTVRCPYHGIEFDGRGRCVHVPELQRPAPGLGVPTLPCVEAHGFVWVWVGDGQVEQAAVPWFDNLGPEFVHSRIDAQWPTHFSRWIENELDVTHLPFVHASTIGRGFDPTVPSRFEFDERGILILFDQKDPRNRSHQFARLLYPNIWQLAVSPAMFLVMAFAAIDDEHTKLYFRTYRSFGTLPLVKPVVDLLINAFNRKVVAQDRRVVLSQQPRSSAKAVGEMLFREDAAVRHYRSLIPGFVEPLAFLRETPVRFQRGAVDLHADGAALRSGPASQLVLRKRLPKSS
jgi:phenylpropionate dioxygenase-like ring-hydroxylating dioxygenase large terminal subunit